MSVVELAVRPLTGTGDYRVDILRSPAGEASMTVRLDVPELLARRTEIAAIVLASARWSQVPDHAERSLRDIGHLLFSATLGSADVAGRYQASAALAIERADGLRVVVNVDDPALAALPWEAMYDAAHGEYLCRRHQLVRRVPVGSMPDPLTVRPPLRILVVIASPTGTPPLNVEKEQQQLSDALSSLRNNKQVEIHFATQATWASLQDLLLSREWHVVHFIGHGTFDIDRGEGILILVGDNGRAHRVDAASLVDLMRQARPMPRLLVLNSSSGARTSSQDLFSGSAAALVRGGVSAVTAMQFAISDDAATAFARGFYSAIAHGRGIDDATSSGRVAILGTGKRTLEWVTPVTYLRGHDDSRLFAMSMDTEAQAEVLSDLRGILITDRWENTAGSAELHEALLTPESSSLPSVRIGIMIAAAKLDSRLTTSQLRSDFLRFLGKQPITDLTQALRVAGTDSHWTSRAGDGRIQLEASLSQAATATLRFPQMIRSDHHEKESYAHFALQIRPGTSDRGLAQAGLENWHQRMVIALAIPIALAEFLQVTLGIDTSGDPAVRFAIQLSARTSIRELIDTHGLTTLPGAGIKKNFEAYAISAQRGQQATDAAAGILTELCDRVLYLQNYEPILAALPRRPGRTDAIAHRDKSPAQAGADGWAIQATDRGIVGIHDGLMIVEWALNRVPDPEWLQFLINSGTPRPASLAGASHQPRIYGTRLRYAVPESYINSAVTWVEESIPIANLRFQTYAIAMKRVQSGP